MRKLAFGGSAILYFLTSKIALAQTSSPAIIISPPGAGYNKLGDFVSNALVLSFGIAVLIVLVMLVWGAFEWVVSGGDKEAVGKARNRIINALIGLAVLAIAFAVARLFGQFIGLDITNITIPTPP